MLRGVKMETKPMLAQLRKNEIKRGEKRCRFHVFERMERESIDIRMQYL